MRRDPPHRAPMNLLLMYSNEPPSAQHVERLAALRANVHVRVARDEEEAVAAAPHIDVALGHRYLRQILPHAPHLRWVQSTAAGVQHLMSPALLERAPLLTRCPIFSEQVALHAWALALAVVRRIPESALAQHQGNWDPPRDLLPFPRLALVLGMGCVGRALGNLLRGTGLRVLGVARRGTAEQRAACDELIPASDWRVHLPRVDLCFVCVTATRATLGMLDEAALRLLPPHAVLVNVSQRQVVDARALADLLRAGHLGGVAMDIQAPSPADDDPLRNAPRLLITPKIAVFYQGRQSALESYIEGQVQRYLSGAVLLHRVDLQRLAEEVQG